MNPLPPTLNTNDSATASDHLPARWGVRCRAAQIGGCAATEMLKANCSTLPAHTLVRSNQSVTLTWESVPGQSYTVESVASLGVSNGRSVMATHLLATNDVLHWSTNGALEANFFRVKRGG